MLHYQISIKLGAVWISPPREEIGHPILDSLGSRPIMSPEPVLGELILMYWLHPVVVEAEGIFLRISHYHLVFRLPPFNGLIKASKQPILLQLGLLGKKYQIS